MKHSGAGSIQQCNQPKDKVVYQNECNVCKEKIPAGLQLTNICTKCLIKPIDLN